MIKQFSEIQIFSQLVKGKWGNNLTVADSGYKNTSHIVTSVINPRGNIEELYNESIIRTRNPVERVSSHFAEFIFNLFVFRVNNLI